MFVENIQELIDDVIDFDRRFEGDAGNDCLMSVDGTDFRIPQKGLPMKGNAFASHKYAGKSALRYEPGVSILGGDLVWIQGPYPAGKYTDIIIFNKVLFPLGRRARGGRRRLPRARGQNQVPEKRRESDTKPRDAGPG